jgi:hypothetical protein
VAADTDGGLPQKPDLLRSDREVRLGPKNETALAVERYAQACAGVER